MRRDLGTLVLMLLLPIGLASGLPSVAGPGGGHGEETTGEIVVVVHASNPVDSLTLSELRRIFLRKQLKWGDRRAITVYERHTDTTIRQTFAREVFGKKPSAFNEYWLNLKLTRGLKPPKALRTARLVKQYVRRVKGGIGYLYASELDDSVKAVRIVEK